MRRARGLTAVALFVLLLAGCGWLEPGFTAGQTSSNDFETTINAGNVGTLVDHVAPGLGGRPLVVGGLLVVLRTSGVSVFTLADCPTASQSACAPLWSRPNVTAVASDGTSIFAFEPGHGLTALDLHGTPLWDSPPVPDTPNHSSLDRVNRVSVSGGYVFFSQVHVDHDFSEETLYEVRAAGCGASHCAPLRTFSPNFQDGATWAIDGGRLFQVSGTAPMWVTAYDIATGAELWRSVGESSFQKMVARNGSLYVVGSSPAGIQVYDESGEHCTGSPKTCSPLRTLFTEHVADLAAVTSDRVVATDAFDSVSYWFRTDALGCTGAPLTCGPVAETNQFTAQGVNAGRIVVANELVYVSSGTHLFVYDLSAGRSCTGAFRICPPPLATKTFASTISAPIVWGGKVYFFTDDALHALSLPS